MNNEHCYDVGGVFGALASEQSWRRQPSLLVSYTASLRTSSQLTALPGRSRVVAYLLSIHFRALKPRQDQIRIAAICEQTTG